VAVGDLGVPATYLLDNGSLSISGMSVTAAFRQNSGNTTVDGTPCDPRSPDL